MRRALPILLLAGCARPPEPPAPACVPVEVRVVIPPGVAPPPLGGAAPAPGARTAAPPPYRVTLSAPGAPPVEGVEPEGAPARFCVPRGEWVARAEAAGADDASALLEVVPPGPARLSLPPPTSR